MKKTMSFHQMLQMICVPPAVVHFNPNYIAFANTLAIAGKNLPNNIWRDRRKRKPKDDHLHHFVCIALFDFIPFCIAQTFICRNCPIDLYVSSLICFSKTLKKNFPSRLAIFCPLAVVKQEGSHPNFSISLFLIQNYLTRLSTCIKTLFVWSFISLDLIWPIKQ